VTVDLPKQHGKMNGMKSLYIGSVLKYGVWWPDIGHIKLYAP